MSETPPPQTLTPPTDSGPDPGPDQKRKREEPESDPQPQSLTPSNDSGPDPGPDQKRKREEPESDPQPQTVSESGSGQGSSNQSHPLYKTSLCSFYRRNSGTCSHGEGCRFAHSEEELRARPDGSWDPTSDRAKKVARIDEDDDEDGGEGESEIVMTDMLAECGGDQELSRCLVGLPRKWVSDQFKSFLDDQGVIVKSAKKKRGMTVGFITFEALDHAKRAVKVLDGKTVGNKELKVRDVVPRSYDDKIKSAQKKYETVQSGTVDEAEASVNAGDDENGCKENGSDSKLKSAREVVTPLAHMPYIEQLEQKKSSLMQMLKKLTRNARKACPKGIQLPEWIVKSREIGGLPCKLEGIIESPLINGYRNKCEFSVGYSVQGKPTVGFMLGNFREGITAVEEPTNCPNVSRISCKYASFFQEFLQDSTLPIWNRFNNKGFWRQLTVREGQNPERHAEGGSEEANISEVLVMVQVSTAGYDDDLINSELEKMRLAFVTGAASSSPPLPLTALVLQDHTGISNAAPADAPLRALSTTNQTDTSAEVVNETRIHDYISSLRFSISPTAFFQVNTLAAEKLYSLAGDWAGLGSDTLLFDVCCGTGTIGLTLANRVGMVIGIEMNASAVSDAQRNAEMNGISNCKFICSKAEDVMASLLKEYLNVPEQEEASNPADNNRKPNESTDNENTSVSDGSKPEKCSTEEGMEIDHSDGTDKKSEHQESNVSSVKAENGNAKKKQFKNVVAIVDPPRSGLHPVVIKALRTHPCLRRLVYISCNPETLVANAIELCTPAAEKTEKGNRGHGWRNMSNASLARQRLKSMPVSEPFQPVKAMPVDLFPHTPHCELVILLER